jgi:hypothetical protein
MSKAIKYKNGKEIRDENYMGTNPSWLLTESEGQSRVGETAKTIGFIPAIEFSLSAGMLGNEPSPAITPAEFITEVRDSIRKIEKRLSKIERDGQPGFSVARTIEPDTYIKPEPSLRNASADFPRQSGTGNLGTTSNPPDHVVAGRTGGTVMPGAGVTDLPDDGSLTMDLSAARRLFDGDNRDPNWILHFQKVARRKQ